MHIYSRASAKGKRVQVSSYYFLLVITIPSFRISMIASQWLRVKITSCLDYFVQSNMGAKNHGIVLPDANIDATLNALVAAGFGAAGQRCMALSTVVFVGQSQSWYYVCFN